MAAIPEGFHTITPFIVVGDGNEALALYERAFGAEIVSKLNVPGSDAIMHAMVKIGSSMLFLCDENPEAGMIAPKDGAGSRFYLYIEDIDAAHERAVDAGMDEQSAPQDMFWGDRISILQDPWGHRWTLSTHVKDVTPEDMAEAMKAMAG